MAIIYLETEH